MKHKTTKKALALMLSLAMAVTFGVPAFAADSANGTQKVNFTKNLYVSNPSLSKVAGPGESFAYKIEAVSPGSSNGGTQAQNSNGEMVNVKKGKGDAIKWVRSKAEFPAKTMFNASSAGAKNSRTMSFNVAPGTLGEGMFRYKITEYVPNGLKLIRSEKENAVTAYKYVDIHIEKDEAGTLVFTEAVFRDKDGNGDANVFPDATFKTYNTVFSISVDKAKKDFKAQCAVAGDNSRPLFARLNSSPAAEQQYVVTKTNKKGNICADSKVNNGDKFYVSGYSAAANVFLLVTNYSSESYKVSLESGTAVRLEYDDEENGGVGLIQMTVPKASRTSGKEIPVSLKMIKSVNDCSVKMPQKVTYTGKKLTPKIYLTDRASGKLLVKGTDYKIVRYKNNVKPGRATVRVAGKKSFGGIRSLHFTIVPKKTQITSTQNNKDGFVIKVKKCKGASGYVFRFTDKNGNDTYKYSNSTTLKVTDLKGTYKVKAAAYVKVGDVKHAGAYSKAKTCKIK